MKIDFKLSTHTVDKHLDESHSQASVFFDKGTMYQSIERCLEKPDVCTKIGRRFEATKTFMYNIGLLGHKKQPSRTVKVVLFQDQIQNFRSNSLSCGKGYLFIHVRCKKKLTNQKKLYDYITPEYVCRIH